MRVAIVDLGTNTFSLLIADIQKADYQVLYHAREVVKLGEGGITQNNLAQAAFQRGVKAMQHLAEYIKLHRVETIRAYATSAIREASNGNDFILEIKNKTGIEVEIISGDKEAELIYYGNKMAVKLTDEPSLIMDIGGGSNEFIIANNTTIFWKQSFKLGVARLLSLFNPEDPITEKTLELIKQHLKTELQTLFIEIQKHPVATLVGSSGAFESVLHMIGKEFISERKTCYQISLADYYTVSKRTIQSTAAERAVMPGLIPMRRDMIVLSYILIDFILDNTSIKKIHVSTYSLKEGVIHSYLQ